MQSIRRVVGRTAVVLSLAAATVVGAPALAGAATTSHHGAHATHATDDTAPTKPTAEAFDRGMRKLWEDHITWTRLFIVSATADLPDLQATTDRLLQNQTDIGDAIKPFYGDRAGTQLTALLRTHILTAADLLAAAKAADNTKLQQAKTDWYANADDIAAFLSKANPRQWSASDMKAMMRTHLDLTLDEAVAHLEGRYTDDVAAYDRVHDEILQMADMLSSGIEHQFPKRFA
jgi:hypothetical protein